jgi:potassium efflux system protein
LRKFLIGLAVLLSTVVARAAYEVEQSTLDQFNARLDEARATLDEVETALAETSLSDATLKHLRDRVEALPVDLQDVIDKLTPRLAALQARLDELGGPKQSEKKDAAPAPPPATPPPEPREEQKRDNGNGGANAAKTRNAGNSKIKAPAAAPGPEPPSTAAPADAELTATATVNAEWAEQRKLYEEVEATLKRARALVIEARQTALTLKARQRALFAKTLFLRTSSLFAPSLWSAAARELPYDVKIFEMLVEERAKAVAAKLRDGQLAAFLMTALAILLLIAPATWLARRVSARSPDAADPSPFQKAAAALWATLVTAIVPIGVVSGLVLAVDAFDLGDPVLEPLGRRLVEAVAFIAVAYALAKGLLAPGLPQWRLIGFSDRLAGRVLRVAVAIGAIVPATRVLEQIAELVQAGLPAVVIARGAGALMIASVVLVAVLAFRRRVENDEARGPNASARDWGYLLRLAAWVELVVILGALAAGYVAFANFLVLQIAWVATVGAALYLLLSFVEAGLAQALQPTAPFGRGLVLGFGARRESLGQLAVLLTGVATICLYALALFALLVPYGFQSGDVLGNLQTAFFGFKIGDVTISPSNMATALALFAITYGATRALRRWLDQRYLPLTRLDTGLRNSIATSLGYAGFIVAVSLALAELGLGLERLAIVAGALSVGIGFGLQSIVNNFVSGLILLWERAIRVGDWVVLGDEQGYVRRINVRSTEIETFDRATMIVPNSNLVSGVVKNWLRNDRVGRIKIALAPPASVDPEQIRSILFAAAKAQDGVLRIPAPQVMFLGMEATVFRFELWCFVEDVEQSTRVKSDLYFDLYRRLKEAGVSITPAAPTPPTTIVQLTGLEKIGAGREANDADAQGFAVVRPRASAE